MGRKFAQSGRPDFNQHLKSSDGRGNHEEMVFRFSAAKLFSAFCTGLPDFSWYNLPSREKYTK
jgi:hypothetical protein